MDAVSFQRWADVVRAFLGTNDTNAECQSYSSWWIVGRSHSCSVALSDCQAIDPEFKADLASLPVTNATTLTTSRGTNDTIIDLSKFQAFVDKWVHGTVDKVAFGFIESEVSLILDDEQNTSKPTLYMGRAGGSANYASGHYYTEEACDDPAPINLGYQPWDYILKELFLWDDDPVVLDLDFDAIGTHFWELRRTYPILSQQLRAQNLQSLNCPSTPSPALTTPLPTDSPSPSPSEWTTQLLSESSFSSLTSTGLIVTTLLPSGTPTPGHSSGGSRIRVSIIMLVAAFAGFLVGYDSLDVSNRPPPSSYLERTHIFGQTERIRLIV